jgi:bifunctional non-homologous end joining protein LigD
LAVDANKSIRDRSRRSRPAARSQSRQLPHPRWKQGERVKVWTRRGADFTYRFPMIVEAVRALNVDRALIDGEAVVLRKDGRSDFSALLTKRGGAQVSLVAFDLLRLSGDDLRLRPIEQRQGALQRLVNGAGGILFSEALAAEGAVVFAKACKLGLEGIVSKREGSCTDSPDVLGAREPW